MGYFRKTTLPIAKLDTGKPDDFLLWFRAVFNLPKEFFVEFQKMDGYMLISVASYSYPPYDFCLILFSKLFRQTEALYQKLWGFYNTFHKVLNEAELEHKKFIRNTY